MQEGRKSEKPGNEGARGEGRKAWVFRLCFRSLLIGKFVARFSWIKSREEGASA